MFNESGRVALFLAVALAAGCQSLPRNDAADLPRVRAALDALASANKAGDLERVVGLYTGDAILLPPDGATVSGREAIRRRYAPGFEHFRLELRFDSEETRVAGDWAFDRGTMRGRAVPKGPGQPTTTHDRYLMILRREADGAWRIARLMWTPAGALPAGR